MRNLPLRPEARAGWCRSASRRRGWSRASITSAITTSTTAGVRAVRPAALHSPLQAMIVPRSLRLCSSSIDSDSTQSTPGRSRPVAPLSPTGRCSASRTVPMSYRISCGPRRRPPEQPDASTSPRLASRALPSRVRFVLAHGLLHKRGDLCLFGGSQLAERVLNRPHDAVVDFLLVAEAERLVSDFELPCVLEVTDHIAVLGVRGHSVPRLRCEARCCGRDPRMDLLGNGATRLLQPGDSRKQLRLPIRLGRLGLQLTDTLARGGLFFSAESLGCHAVRAGALRRFLRALSCSFRRGHGSRSCPRIDEDDA